MTSSEAAEILRVSTNASPADIERAYRIRARLSHPDLLAGAPPREVAAAAAEFGRITQARELLIHAAERRDSPDSASGDRAAAGGAAGGSAAGGDPQGFRRSPAWWVFSAWVILLAFAIAVSFDGGPLPKSWPDLLLRLVPLGVVSVAYAATGRRFLFIVMTVLVVITVALTVLFASFASLLVLELVLAPVIALAVIGRGRRVRP
jgi:hypothetical protein